MSELKCPFCNGELVGTIGHPICRNQNCVMCDDPMPQDLLEEFIRTKKQLVTKCNQLKIAVDALKRIDETRSGVKENLHATNGRTLNAGNGFCWTTIDDIHNAQEQITALEQKDVK